MGSSGQEAVTSMSHKITTGVKDTQAGDTSWAGVPLTVPYMGCFW